MAKTAAQLKNDKAEKVKPKTITFDRPINNEDIWVVTVDGEPRRFVGIKDTIMRYFNNQKKSWNVKVKIRFINKDGRNTESYEV